MDPKFLADTVKFFLSGDDDYPLIENAIKFKMQPRQLAIFIADSLEEEMLERGKTPPPICQALRNGEADIYIAGMLGYV